VIEKLADIGQQGAAPDASELVRPAELDSEPGRLVDDQDVGVAIKHARLERLGCHKAMKHRRTGRGNGGKHGDR